MSSVKTQEEATSAAWLASLPFPAAVSCWSGVWQAYGRYLRALAEAGDFDEAFAAQIQLFNEGLACFQLEGWGLAPCLDRREDGTGAPAAMGPLPLPE